MEGNSMWLVEEELIKRYIDQKNVNFKYSKSVFSQKEQICLSTFNKILKKHGYFDLIKKRTVHKKPIEENIVKTPVINTSVKHSRKTESNTGGLSSLELAKQIINGSN